MVIRIGAPMFRFDAEALGPVTFKQMSFNHMVELEDADETLSPPAFVDRLILSLGRRGEGDEAAHLTSDDIDRLLPGERAAIVAQLIEGLGFVFDDRSTPDSETDASETRCPPRLARGEGEVDEAYLQRGWLAYQQRTRERMSAAFQPFVSGVARIGEDIRKAIAPGLFANLEASQRVTDQVAQMRRMTDVGRFTLPQAAGSTAPRPNLTNPIHETNKRLATLADHLGEMRTLAANTAAMQETLNGYARDILTGFAVGAKESKAAGDEALKVARISAGLALLAILVGIGATGYQDWKSSQQQATERARYAEERALRQRELTETARLLDALKPSENQTSAVRGP